MLVSPIFHLSLKIEATKINIDKSLIKGMNFKSLCMNKQLVA